MTFEEVLNAAIALLQRQGRVAYRVLKRQFDLEDDYLEDLKEAILYAHPQVRDDGRGLLWSGDTSTASVSPAPQPTPQTTSLFPDAERRQLTVLFCDLADSTRLAQQLDPEDLRAVVRAYQETAAAVIQRYEGHIAQYLGDGLLVYFGYPQAHEDDTQRAVRTGLELLAALRTLNTQLVQEQGVRLAVRIGIHTGLVVVGAMGSGGRHEHLALGATPNIAARLQGLAAPDTVVISAATARLVHGYFTCQDLGPQTLKGMDTPVRVLQVTGESPAQSRLEVAAASGLTPLVGRETELTLLRERWAQARNGLGQVVLLSGEAGIGKSRLVRLLTERVMAEGTPRLTLHCSPYHTNSAFYPIIDHLQRRLHWHRDVPSEAKLTTLEQAVQAIRLPLEEVVPLLATLLAVPLPERYPPLNLSPQRQKQQTQEALVAWLLAETVQQPVLIVWEDLHWADPSTLELLGLLLDQVPTARLLLVLIARPEFRPPWSTHVPVTQVTLTRLGRPQVETMLTHLTGGKALPAEVVHQIVAKTDGVPLFVEELVKMVLASGLLREGGAHYVLTGPLPLLAIPATLHDSLMARLDRLATARDLAQLGAVLGREFSYELLQSVSSLDELTLRQGLAQLVEAELLYQRGLPPRSQYTFKHALIQDAAYQSLLKSTRQQMHQQIAQVLEAQFPETVETQPELLAHHYTEAGLMAQAIPYWQRAGQHALERSANVEAVGHFTKGLALLKTLPDTPEHARQELALHIALGAPLTALHGLSAPEVGGTYGRALELCQQMQDTPELIPVLVGLWRFYLSQGAHQTARALAEQLLQLADRVQDPTLRLEAHRPLGQTLFYMGEFAPARAHLEQAIALYDPQQHRAHVFRYGHDAGVACLCHVSEVLWCLGAPDDALHRGREALAVARELAHSQNLVFALFFTAMLYQFRREGSAVQEWIEAFISLSTAQGLPYMLDMAKILQGWVLAEQGEEEAGIAQMRQGLSSYQARGSEFFRPYFLALLAMVCGKVGQAEHGLTALAEALAVMERTGERWWEAELYRVQGELLLQQAAGRGQQVEEEAETCFQQALTVARRQQAKSLELRAAMSLARLWQQQGKRDHARELLAPIYGWFTEGFDTADLQEAQVLLDELR